MLNVSKLLNDIVLLHPIVRDTEKFQFWQRNVNSKRIMFKKRSYTKHIYWKSKEGKFHFILICSTKIQKCTKEMIISMYSMVIKSNCNPQAESCKYDPVIRRNWRWLHFNQKHISVQNGASKHEKGTVVAPVFVSIWGFNLNFSVYSARLLTVQRNRRSKPAYSCTLFHTKKLNCTNYPVCVL